MKKTPTNQQLKEAIRPIVESILNEETPSILDLHIKTVKGVLGKLQSAIRNEFGDAAEEQYYQDIYKPFIDDLKRFISSSTRK